MCMIYFYSFLLTHIQCQNITFDTSVHFFFSYPKSFLLMHDIFTQVWHLGTFYVSDIMCNIQWFNSDSVMSTFF